MIREMEESLEKLASDIQAVDSSYMSTKGRDYLSFSEDGIGFVDRIGLTTSLLGAAAVLCAAFVCVFFGKFLSGKEEKDV